MAARRLPDSNCSVSPSWSPNLARLLPARKPRTRCPMNGAAITRRIARRGPATTSPTSAPTNAPMTTSSRKSAWLRRRPAFSRISRLKYRKFLLARNRSIVRTAEPAKRVSCESDSVRYGLRRSSGTVGVRGISTATPPNATEVTTRMIPIVTIMNVSAFRSWQGELRRPQPKRGCPCLRNGR